MKIAKLGLLLFSFFLMTCAINNASLVKNNLIIIKDGLNDINYDKIANVDASEVLSVANDYKLNKEYRLAVSLYSYIILHNSDTEHAPEAQWQIADIYINDLNEYLLGIEELYKIVENFPDSNKSENALFMMGYIYNNSLNSYSDAINVYNSFIERYPASELIPSINYELENLQKTSDIIRSMGKE